MLSWQQSSLENISSTCLLCSPHYFSFYESYIPIVNEEFKNMLSGLTDMNKCQMKKKTVWKHFLFPIRYHRFTFFKRYIRIKITN